MPEHAARAYDSGWTASDLERDRRWIYHSSSAEQAHLIDLAHGRGTLRWLAMSRMTLILASRGPA